VAQGTQTRSRTNTVRAARQARRLNRSEQRAMEIREANSLAGAASTTVDEPVIAPGASVRQRRRQDQRQSLRTVSLTREQEYGFIRADLRRVLLLSGALIVAMVAALFIIEAIV
jgi:hypothetical protein